MAIVWGELKHNEDNRKEYLEALQKADQHDDADIIVFINSRSKRIN